MNTMAIYLARTVTILAAALLFAGAVQSQDQAVEATTATGEKVKLFPNGRWEFVNQQKAAVQRQAVEADIARDRASQGGLFGFGRRVQEGDKDYNRGSLNPKTR